MTGAEGVGLASSFDLLHKCARRRPRRRDAAWSEVDAIAFIRERAGSDFDPQVVVAFLALLQETGK